MHDGLVQWLAGALVVAAMVGFCTGVGARRNLDLWAMQWLFGATAGWCNGWLMQRLVEVDAIAN